MKKIVSILLVFLLVFSFSMCTAYAEKNTSTSKDTTELFDYNALLADIDGYSYDKFDRKWKWSKAYVKEYSDAVVGIGIQTLSVEGGDSVQETDLFVKVLDKETSEIYEEIQSIDFLIDDDIYSFKKLNVGTNSSLAPLGENGKLLIEAIAFCNPKDVEVRISSKDNSYEIAIDPVDFTWSLKDYCRTYLKLNIAEFFNDPTQMAAWEKMFPLTINGETAVYSEMKKDRDLSKIDKTFTEPKPTQSPAPTAAPKGNSSTNTNGNESAAEKNAVRSAKSYLNVMGFSREGLINQLVTFDKFTQEQATYGVDHCGADWNEQAKKSAKNYLSVMGFSRDGLINQLETFDNYTHDQAVYGADNSGADWNEQAVKSGQAYLNVMGFSRDGLINQLVTFDKFTYEQASYAADKLGL